MSYCHEFVTDYELGIKGPANFRIALLIKTYALRERKNRLFSSINTRFTFI